MNDTTTASTRPVEIVKFSMGICSAYIACRLQETCHAPVCLFNDTMREDADTYRFGREIVEVWGLNLVEINDGRDLWDVFTQEQIIPARQISMCSKRMKIQPGEKFLRNWPSDIPARVSCGYDVDEQDRADRMIRQWNLGAHQTPWFPLIEWGVTKQQCFGYFLEHGIEPPSIYRHFQHANCLPCKNFRRNDWLALRFHYPAKFAEAVAFEAEAQQWPTPGRWMQDDCLLSELPGEGDPGRKGRRALAMAAPAFNFAMECDACAVD